MRNTKIISGFPGVGKSYLFDKNKDLSILDSDSSSFSWIEKGVRHPEFPQNYIEHIKSNIGEADIILVSSHKTVRDALRDNNIKYILAYPAKRLKQEYIARFRARGNDDAFIKMIDTNWDNFIDEIEQETFPTLLRLWEGEYLGDILTNPYCNVYKEFCTVNKTNADEYEGNPCCGCKRKKLLIG